MLLKQLRAVAPDDIRRGAAGRPEPARACRFASVGPLLRRRVSFGVRDQALQQAQCKWRGCVADCDALHGFRRPPTSETAAGTARCVFGAWCPSCFREIRADGAIPPARRRSRPRSPRSPRHPVCRPLLGESLVLPGMFKNIPLQVPDDCVITAVTAVPRNLPYASNGVGPRRITMRLMASWKLVT